MIEVQVAGAGAGKTYGLAKNIADSIEGETSFKKIYAITYTNNARDEIEQQLINIFGFVPDRIKVETVHNFLLNEIIYPFTPFVTGTVYSSATTMPLADNVKYRNIQKGKLKRNAVLHADDVYAAARRVVDRTMTVHSTKAKKGKVDRVLQILSCAIDRIYIDEVQDLDKTALGVFEVLGRNVADIYMVGDPKQAIKYPKPFIEFIEKYEGDKDAVISVQPHDNKTRRVPTKILNISNRFCFKGQEQISVSSVHGNLCFIESTNPDYRTFIEDRITAGQIVCVDKKCAGYSTHGTKYTLPPEVCDLIQEVCGYFDPDIYLKAANLKFFRDIAELGRKAAVGNVFEDYSIAYDKKIYAMLMSVVSRKDPECDAVLIRSIDSVKGLESDDCVLVLTPNTYRYLIQNSLEEKDRHNKEWNKIYVALTRAKNRFIVAIDHDLFRKQKYSTDHIKDNLLKNGFDML